MLEELKIIGTKYKFYSTEYWIKVKEVVDRDDSTTSEYIISYLSEIRKENFDYKEFLLILVLVQALYPFRENQINELGSSFTNSIKELSKINKEELVGKRDHLLYIIMDILFHHGELIIEVNESVRNALFESIIIMSNLKYEVNEIDGDSYFKNYKVIQFLGYFKDKQKMAKIVNNYRNHFDDRLKRDINFEIKEYYYDIQF